MSSESTVSLPKYELVAEVYVTATRLIHVHRSAADGTLRIRMLLNDFGRMPKGGAVFIPKDYAAEIGRALVEASR